MHIPANLDDSVMIHISTHELRILTMWADNWARYIADRSPDAPKVVRLILDRLATQTSAALTLGQEIADVRAEFPEGQVRIYNSQGEEVEP
jgi:hypothetical protein